MKTTGKVMTLEGSKSNVIVSFSVPKVSNTERQHLFKTFFLIFEYYPLRMTDKAKYWVELSDYDLMTADAMMKSSRFLYVGFLCHQTVEKIFKAYYVELKNANAPFSHSLSYIARKADFYDDFAEEQKKFIDQLEPLNIETRYPLDKEKVLKSLNQDKCREILNKTRGLQEWIKLKL